MVTLKSNSTDSITIITDGCAVLEDRCEIGTSIRSDITGDYTCENDGTENGEWVSSTNACTGCDGGFVDIIDTDGDGFDDDEDNCPDVANADQTDANDNSIGDACEIRRLPGVELRKPDYEFELNTRPQIDFEIEQPQILEHHVVR